MSKASIAAKALQIRNETQDYANTKGRVADVLDDINDTKPDEIVVADMIEEALEGFDLTTKINKPTWSGITEYYFVKSDAGINNLQQFSLTTFRVPYWTGNNFASSPLIVSTDGTRVGVGATSTSEVLEVSGNAKVNALILPVNSTSAVANRLRSNGSRLYYSNSSSVESTIAYMSDLQFSNVIEVNTSTLTLSNAYKNRVILFTANCAVTIPTGLDSDFNCAGTSTSAVNVTINVASGVTSETDGINLIPKGTFSILPRALNSYLIKGDLV